MFDLLNNKSRLRILENARHEVQIVGLNEEPVYDLSDVLALISAGNACRYIVYTCTCTYTCMYHCVYLHVHVNQITMSVQTHY